MQRAVLVRLSRKLLVEAHKATSSTQENTSPVLPFFTHKIHIRKYPTDTFQSLSRFPLLCWKHIFHSTKINLMVKFVTKINLMAEFVTKINLIAEFVAFNWWLKKVFCHCNSFCICSSCAYKKYFLLHFSLHNAVHRRSADPHSVHTLRSQDLRTA